MQKDGHHCYFLSVNIVVGSPSPKWWKFWLALPPILQWPADFCFPKNCFSWAKKNLPRLPFSFSFSDEAHLEMCEENECFFLLYYLVLELLGLQQGKTDSIWRAPRPWTRRQQQSQWPNRDEALKKSWKCSDPIWEWRVFCIVHYAKKRNMRVMTLPSIWVICYSFTYYRWYHQLMIDDAIVFSNEFHEQDPMKI